MAKKNSVEVVIPIYNEEKELNDSIVKLYAFLKKNLDNCTWHITIADNASTDRSLSIGKSLEDKFKEVSVLHLTQKGRGRAVKKAWRNSGADILMYMDADLSTDLKNLNKLISSLNGGFDIAIGSRLTPESEVVNRPIKREILSRGYNILIKLLFWTHFSDAQCGFKAVKREVVENLLPHIKNDEWFFDSELLIVGEKEGYKINEIPVRWVDNPGSTVKVLGTVTGDLLGLWRLFLTRPWLKKERKK